MTSRKLIIVLILAELEEDVTPEVHPVDAYANCAFPASKTQEYTVGTYSFYYSLLGVCLAPGFCAMSG